MSTNDTERILAAIAHGAQQQVNLQRSVDRIVNDHVALRQDVTDIKGEVISQGARISTLEGARKYSDRARAGLSDADAKHESDMAAVIAEVEAVKQQQFALMAVNQKQTSVLDLLRGSRVQRLVKETTRLVILLAAVASAYLSAKGHK